MTTSTIKEDAHRLVDQLGDDASWDDLMYAIYIRLKVDAAWLTQMQAGRHRTKT